MIRIATAPVSPRLAAAACSFGVASRAYLYNTRGRRATKVVTEHGQITSSHRFLYRGYLQNVVNARKIS